MGKALYSKGCVADTWSVDSVTGQLKPSSCRYLLSACPRINTELNGLGRETLIGLGKALYSKGCVADIRSVDSVTGQLKPSSCRYLLSACPRINTELNGLGRETLTGLGKALYSKGCVADTRSVDSVTGQLKPSSCRYLLSACPRINTELNGLGRETLTGLGKALYSKGCVADTRSVDSVTGQLKPSSCRYLLSACHRINRVEWTR